MPVGLVAFMIVWHRRRIVLDIVLWFGTTIEQEIVRRRMDAVRNAEKRSDSLS